MDKCENWLYKGMITISGIDETEDEEPRDLIQNFLEHKIGIEGGLDIMFAFRTGGQNTDGKPRLILFKLIDPNDSALIYGNISNLKGKKDSHGDRYLVKDYITEKTADAKQCFRDIAMENRRMPVSHQMRVEAKSGNLYVNGKKYTKEVVEPTLKDTLLMPKSVEKELKQLPVIPSETKTVQGSNFQAFATKVNMLEDVKATYALLKLQHGSATHIVCAYRIFGIRHYQYQDYADDGEYGAGCRMLAQLKQLGVFNIAIFVVRYKTGGNIGVVRFQTYEELAKVVARCVPEVKHFGQDFQHQDRILYNGLKEAVNRRGRGRGRGGGRPTTTRGGGTFRK